LICEWADLIRDSLHRRWRRAIMSVSRQLALSDDIVRTMM